MREIYLGKQWQLFQRAHHTLEFAKLFAGGLILIENGDRWKEARDLFGKSFTNVQVRKYAPLLLEIQDTFMDAIAKASDGGKNEFNIQPYMTKFTFEFICRVLFGERLGTFEGGENEKYLHAWDDLISLSGILAFLQRGLGDWSLNFAGGVKKRVFAGADVLHQIVFRNIKRRERGEDLDRWSIFDEAMGSGKMPQWMLENNYAELLKQLMTMLFGGT